MASLFRIRRLIPTFDRVLVKKTTPMNRTVGGILLPEQSATKFNWGKVVEVGPGRRGVDGLYTPVSFKKGDNVMLAGWEQPVKVNDEEYTIVREEDILGLLELDGEEKK